jgi:hypothetical protein
MESEVGDADDSTSIGNDAYGRVAYRWMREYRE